MLIFIFGLLLVMGGVGGMDNGESIMLCSGISIIGLFLMFASLPIINKE